MEHSEGFKKFYYRMTTNPDHDVVSQAMLELEYEHFREAVEREKIKMTGQIIQLRA